MLDLSKETNVSYLRAVAKLLQEKLLFAEKEIVQLKFLAQKDEELCKQLSEELLLLKKKFFGRSSERSQNSPTKKNQRIKILHNQPLLAALPAQGKYELEEEEVIHEGFEPSCSCQESYLPMTNAFEESCEVNVIERKYILKRHRRQKYKCSHCSKIVTAKGAEKLIAGGDFSIHMAAQVVDDKFHRHLPLNRQSEMMAEQGLLVGTKTLYSLSEHLMMLMPKLDQMILEEIKSHPWAHMDETPMPILKRRQNGYVWSLSNLKGVYYQYEMTRSHKVAKEIIADYKGIVMTDAYSGYEFLGESSEINHALCLAHCRRKFVDAVKDYPQSQEVIAIFAEIYKNEEEAQRFDNLKKIRKEKSKHGIDKIDQWIKNQEGKYLKTSLLGKAISYYLNHKVGLTKFIDNALIPIDNNAGEREIRRAVLGRKNFYGFRTINGADVGMFFYSIIGSCKMVGVNPKAYILEMGLKAAKKDLLLTPYQYGIEIMKRAKISLSNKMPVELH